jgi:hypothetical protein
MKNKTSQSNKPKPSKTHRDESNSAHSDYKDPTGSNAPGGRPDKNSGYNEKQPAKK